MRTPKKTYLRDRDMDHVVEKIKGASGQVSEMIKKYPGHPEMVDAFEIMRAAKSELSRAYRFKDKADAERQNSFEADSDEEAMEMLEQGAAMVKEILWSVFQVDRLHVLFHALAGKSDQMYEDRNQKQFEDEMDRARNL